VTSYLRMFADYIFVRFFLRSSISTVSSILGSTEVMYFLNESAGWYFFCSVARGTAFPASRFLTTSSTNPERMLIIQYYTPINLNSNFPSLRSPIPYRYLRHHYQPALSNDFLIDPANRKLRLRFGLSFCSFSFIRSIGLSILNPHQD
jgi:hypothetical protein